MSDPLAGVAAPEVRRQLATASSAGRLPSPTDFSEDPKKKGTKAEAKAKAKAKTESKARAKQDRTSKSQQAVDKLAEMVRREVRARLGPDATYEQRRDAAAAVMSEALWKDEDGDLRESVTDSDEVDVDGKPSALARMDPGVLVRTDPPRA